ncbi:hypothetical protein PVK06_007475 [Gossypium arboreum]|uniref:Uncharacterized protein n=1 Tax=Gossypium arboreum TaxID=29729 RepID=A0ABR0QHK2_GOSAR|nr:hypothetical protein PVK06_007475 [Gossypium arboreum]
MPRHGIGEFIRKGYHVRPCQDMAMVSSKRKRFLSNPKSKSKKRQGENMKKEYSGFSFDVNKHALSDQLSPKRKVFSRLGWGLAASLIAITGLMLNSSFNGPVVGSLFQGESGQVDLKDEVDIDREGTQLKNSYEGSKTGNFDVVEGRIQQIAQDANGSVVSKNGDEVILEKTWLGNFSKILNNATLAGKNVNANIVVDNPGGANNVTNLSNNGEVVGHFFAEKKVVELNKTTNSPGGDDHPRVVKGPNGSF